MPMLLALRYPDARAPMVASGTFRRQNTSATTRKIAIGTTAAIAATGSCTEKSDRRSASASTVNSSAGDSTKNASLLST